VSTPGKSPYTPLSLSSLPNLCIRDDINLGRESPYSDALARFENQALVTVACGTTCVNLGDERNLREFLVADEVARRLREAGHVVISLLVDDSLEPLGYRQLRIAADKDELFIGRWADWCGKPIACIPDPWDCHASYAAHFEEALLDRLHSLRCHPNLVSTASLYEGGLYAPYVRQVLERYDEIMRFLTERFPGYQPETLFWVLCPRCGYIDETQIERIDGKDVRYYCRRCEHSGSLPLDEVKGRLNWKLDCAARWVLLRIDAEPFNKAYLEPQCGSYFVAREAGKELFGGRDVLPLRYGLVKIERSVSYRLLPSLPADVLRSLFTERATADITVTSDCVLNAASRCQVEYGLSYLDCVKQLVPMWLLRPQSLTDRQRDLVGHGIRFAEDFLGQEVALQLPTRESLEGIRPDVLEAMHRVLVDIIELRESSAGSWEAFCERAKQLIAALGDSKHETMSSLRAILGQKQGIPASRLLFLVPMNYLQALEYILHLQLACTSDRWQVADRLAA